MRRATAGTTRSVRTTAEHPRPVSKTKGRAHPKRRRQGASDRQSPTRSPRDARAERERQRSDGPREEREKGCAGRSWAKRESRDAVRVAGCAAREARVRGDEGAVGSLPSARQRGDAHREAERSAQRLGRATSAKKGTERASIEMAAPRSGAHEFKSEASERSSHRVRRAHERQ